jgi:hypothetical protein
MINLHRRACAWYRLKSLGLLVWFVRATDTCGFAHVCLYIFDKQRTNKNSCRVQEKSAVFQDKERGTLERTFLCILMALLRPGLSFS